MSTIAVIGAGAAGLESLKILRDAGHRVTAYESRSVVGGHWNTDYEALHLISSANISGFDDWPMPEDYPLFPSRQQVLDYLVAYAEKFDLFRDIRFDTRVLSAVPVRDGFDGWIVRTESGDGDAATVEEHRFDVVIVANGHLSSPVVPDIAGDFTGRQLHAADYHNVDDLTGPNVLVVGAGNSGCDIVVDAAQSRRFAHVSVSIRRGHRFIPKTLFGRPRREISILRYANPWLAQLITRGLMRVSKGTNDRYPGLPAPVSPDLRKQLPIANDLLLYWIHHGRIAPRPGIARIDGQTVVFANGDAQRFDTVVWATGYRAEFPFLDEALVPRKNEVPLKYAGCTLLDNRVAGLYVIGLTGPRGPQFSVYTRQARLVNRLMRLQETSTAPVVERFIAKEPPNAKIDILREDWNTEIARSERITSALERELVTGTVTDERGRRIRASSTPKRT